MTSPSNGKPAKPKHPYLYYCQLWLNTGTTWQVRVLKVSTVTMEPVEEYFVTYNKELGLCESCDCPGYTMHRKKAGGGEHKHFTAVKAWIKASRPLFVGYLINDSGAVAIRFAPQLPT